MQDVKHYNKGGTVLGYLNLRMIQTVHGVSCDKTDHILLKIVHKYVPPDKISTLKPVHTPFRADPEYEKELPEQLPATPTELKELEKRYMGTFPGILVY